MGSLGQFDERQWLEDRGRKPVMVQMGQPRELACWTKLSVNDPEAPLSFQHKERSGLLPFQVPPHLPASLEEGFPHAFVRKPQGERSGVETILEAAQLAGVPVGDYSFVTYRNNLNKVFLTPCCPQDAWAVDACRVGRSMFLDIVKLPQRDYPNSDKFEYYGYKFETLCTGGGDVVDSSSEFGAVMHLHLGDHRLIVGAEVDCYDPARCPPELPAPLSSFVELKTYKMPQSDRQEFNLRQHKFPKWWVQSWLAGVPRIAMGARDGQGQLLRVDVVDTQALPRLAREAGASWQPFQLLAFGHDVLGWMRGIGAQHPEQPLRFEYVPARGSITCALLQQSDMADRLRTLLGSGG